MNIISKTTAAAAIAMIAVAGSANAAPISFDDFKGGALSSAYQASHGVTLTTNAAVWGGNGNGDPGNWNLEGTNGSAFLGCNKGNGCMTTFAMDAAQNGFAVDIGIANNWSAIFTVEGFLGTNLVDTEVLALSNHSVGTSPDGTWSTAALVGTLDSVKITSAFTKGFAFGIDNVDVDGTGPSVNPSAVPVPAALPLMGAGLVGLGLIARKRKSA
jgi:hypothetical protein